MVKGWPAPGPLLSQSAPGSPARDWGLGLGLGLPSTVGWRWFERRVDSAFNTPASQRRTHAHSHRPTFLTTNCTIIRLQNELSTRKDGGRLGRWRGPQPGSRAAEHNKEEAKGGCKLRRLVCLASAAGGKVHPRPWLSRSN